MNDRRHLTLVVVIALIAGSLVMGIASVLIPTDPIRLPTPATTVMSERIVYRDREVTARPTRTATLTGWQRTATARPTSTRGPYQTRTPTRVPTVTFPRDDESARSETG